MTEAAQPGTSSAEVRLLISAEDLERRVAALGAQISADYAGKSLVLVGVLKGAWIFLADLVRQLSIPVQCDFLKVSSYGSGRETTGQVDIHFDVSIDLAGKHVLLVEDIVDTGLCLQRLLEHLQTKQPASLRVCSLLDKPARRLMPVPVDYLGFTLPNHFVVGYGVDWDERYRELPYIGYVPAKE